MTDGITTEQITLQGHYTQSSFAIAQSTQSDAYSGGTIVTVLTSQGQTSPGSVGGQPDSLAQLGQAMASFITTGVDNAQLNAVGKVDQSQELVLAVAQSI